MAYPQSFIDFCATIDYRLTSLRKKILFILWDSAKPLKAYEILNRLLLTKQNSMPPTVYRVLDFLVDCGVVHKIESIQSYALCQEPDKQLSTEILMVCNNCHQVMEIYNKEIHTLISLLSKDKKFYLGQDAIELKGFCDKCHNNNCSHVNCS